MYVLSNEAAILQTFQAHYLSRHLLGLKLEIDRYGLIADLLEIFHLFYYLVFTAIKVIFLCVICLNNLKQK